MVAIPGYAINKKIGDGGCAEIFHGVEYTTKREVAVKVLLQRHKDYAVERKRLQSEGQIGLQLQPHPNLVRVIHAGTVEETGFPYLVMEYIKGRTLRQLLTERKKFTNAEILHIGEGVARALAFLGQSGVYHQDIKPDNIMMDSQGTIKVIDLGLAETRLKIKLSFFGRTLGGSPGYMAPEVLRNKKPSDTSDLYALGCTLYEAACGKTPFVGTNEQETVNNQLNLSLKAEPLVRPAAKDNTVTLPTQKMIFMAIEKRVEQRYKSIDEFMLDLSRNPGRANTTLIRRVATSAPVLPVVPSR